MYGLSFSGHLQFILTAVTFVTAQDIGRRRAAPGQLLSRHGTG